jgi:hypothetical protein
MKKILLFAILALMVLPVLAIAQPAPSTVSNGFINSVATQEINNKRSHHTFLGTGGNGVTMLDTLNPVSGVQPNKAPLVAGKVKFLAGMIIGTGIAADSIIIWQVTSAGAAGDTLVKIANVTTSTGYINLGIPIDSGFVVAKRFKADDITFIIRPLY